MTTSLPLLFAIKRYALHDGPAIRLTLFFKGCPLSCFWCHNPEGIGTELDVITVADRCIGCRACLDECPETALQFTPGGISRDRERCTRCLNCVEICPSLAHEAVGRFYTNEELLREIDKDQPFFDLSGGGVTFSGGEPLLQAKPLLELLKACGDREIHRTIDTSGFAPTPTLLAAAERAELFLFDLKHMDSELHRRYTGVPNELILHNLRQLSRSGAQLRIRVPLLAGINDDERNIEASAAFAATLDGLQGIDILPYHHLAGGKYQKLAQTDRGDSRFRPTVERIELVSELFSRYGHQVHIGG